jgi:uncharacterized protein
MAPTLTPIFMGFILDVWSLRYLRPLPHLGGACFRGQGASALRRFPMFFEIQDLERHPIEFAEKFGTGVLDLGADYRQISPVETSGRADLVEEHHGKHEVIKDIRIRGRLATRLETECARCLEPLTQDVLREFDLLYRPQGADAGRDEMSVTDAEAEISYYEGEGLPLEDVVREQILLAVPLKLTCRDDCKGLCPHCGKNRNSELCSCEVRPEEPRWAALKEIRGKLKIM